MTTATRQERDGARRAAAEGQDVPRNPVAALGVTTHERAHVRAVGVHRPQLGAQVTIPAEQPSNPR